MKKTSIAMLISLLSVAGAVFAQTQAPSTEIRESTDSAKIADVEQRAADIQARQQASSSTQDMSSGSSDSTMPRHHGRHGKRHGKMHSHSSAGGNSGNAAGAGGDGSVGK